MKIAVVGTGYVGLVLGACLAENGNDVICVDKDAAKISTLEVGEMPIYEPGLGELVLRNHNEERLTFTTDLAVTLRLAKRIPADKLIVSESGIHQRADVVRLIEVGIHAMLVGESLIRAEDMAAKIRELRGDPAPSHA